MTDVIKDVYFDIGRILGKGRQPGSYSDIAVRTRVPASDLSNVIRTLENRRWLFVERHLGEKRPNTYRMGPDGPEIPSSGDGIGVAAGRAPRWTSLDWHRKSADIARVAGIKPRSVLQTLSALTALAQEAGVLKAETFFGVRPGSLELLNPRCDECETCGWPFWDVHREGQCIWCQQGRILPFDYEVAPVLKS